jgi:hypothetical protein
LSNAISDLTGLLVKFTEFCELFLHSHTGQINFTTGISQLQQITLPYTPKSVFISEEDVTVPACHGNINKYNAFVQGNSIVIYADVVTDSSVLNWRVEL